MRPSFSRSSSFDCPPAFPKPRSSGRISCGACWRLRHGMPPYCSKCSPFTQNWYIVCYIVRAPTLAKFMDSNIGNSWRPLFRPWEPLVSGTSLPWSALPLLLPRVSSVSICWTDVLYSIFLCSIRTSSFRQNHKIILTFCLKTDKSHWRC